MIAVTNHTPTHRRRRTIAAAAALAIVATSLGVASLTVLPTPTTAPCMEDEPCWDCEVMGNRVCGPLTTTHTNGNTIVQDRDGMVIAVFNTP
jgi:hypothetical protein